MATRSDIIRARRKAVGGRRPRCRKGKSCSAACINQNKYCLVDAPTPVEGALPRAVRAIQGRRERLGQREKRQVFKKRINVAKGKLKEQKAKYSRQINSLKVQIRKKSLSGGGVGEWQSISEMKGRLKRLENEVGPRLGVSKSKSVDYDKIRQRVTKARLDFKKRLILLDEKVRAAASSQDKSLYDSLEKKLLSFLKKESILWDRFDDRIEGLRRYKKGKYWELEKEQRRVERSNKLRGIYNKLQNEALQAAKDGDKGRYRESERKLLVIASKAKEKLNLSDVPTKNSLWMDARVPPLLKSLRESMDNALIAGDLNKYKKLEGKFLRIKDNYVKIGDPISKLQKLSDKVSYTSRKGQVLDDFKLSLNRRMEEAASRGNRKDYNKEEKALMALDPNVKKNEVWNKVRVNRAVNILHIHMERASGSSNKGEYKKAENKLIKILDKWREVIDDPYIKGLYKGKMWRDDRLGKRRGEIRETVSRIDKEMMKAIRSNKREVYDRLESRLFRIKDKLGNFFPQSAINEYPTKGGAWSAYRGYYTTEARLKRSEIKKGRDGVEGITLSVSPRGIGVESKVLGNLLEISVSPASTSFTVNGSHTASDNLSRRETIGIIREVTRQYNEIVKSLKDGTVLTVSAAGGDGREEMRVKAYVGFGFSDPKVEGGMYGRVKGSKLIPISEQEYLNERTDSFR